MALVSTTFDLGPLAGVEYTLSIIAIELLALNRHPVKSLVQPFRSKPVKLFPVPYLYLQRHIENCLS